MVSLATGLYGATSAGRARRRALASCRRVAVITPFSRAPRAPSPFGRAASFDLARARSRERAGHPELGGHAVGQCAQRADFLERQRLGPRAGRQNERAHGTLVVREQREGHRAAGAQPFERGANVGAPHFERLQHLGAKRLLGLTARELEELARRRGARFGAAIAGTIGGQERRRIRDTTARGRPVKARALDGA